MYCPACEYAGKPLDIAVYYSNLGEDDCIDALLEDGQSVSQKAREHYKLQRQIRHEMTQLWLKAKENLLHEITEARPIRALLHVPMLSRTEWEARGGSYVGVVQQNEIPQLLKPYLKHCRFKAAVVSPMFDMPGRMSGLCFCYDVKGEAKQKIVYVGRRGGIAGKYVIPEAKNLRDKLFVFLDVVEGLSFVNRFNRINVTPPPVVIAQETAATMEHMFANKNIVIISKLINHDVIRHAKALNAKVYAPTCVWEKNSFNAIKLETAHTHAESWQSHIEKIALKKDKAELASLINGSQLTANDLKDVQEVSSMTVAEMLNSEIQPKSIVYGKHEIEERTNGWYNKKRHDFLTNFNFSVDEIVLTRTNRMPIYKCTINYKGNDYQLIVSEKELFKDKQPASVIVSRMLEQRVPLWYNPNIEKAIVNIGKLFGDPQVTIAENQVLGYDTASNRLNLPNLVYDVNSRDYSQHTLLLPSRPIIGWYGPNNAETIDVETLKFVFAQPGHSKSLLINLLNFVVASLLTPMTKTVKRTLLICSSDYFDDFMRLAGFTAFKPALTRAVTAENIHEVAELGYYPLYIDSDISDKMRQDVIMNSRLPLILSAGPALGVIGMLSDQNIFSVIYTDEKTAGKKKTLEATAKLFNPIVADVLKFILNEKETSHFLVKTVPTHMTDRITWQLIRKYLKARGFTNIAVKPRYLRPNKRLLPSLVTRLVSENKLAMADTFNESNGRAVIRVGRDVAINPSSVSIAACPDTPEIKMDRAKVIAYLERAGIFRGVQRKGSLTEMILADKSLINANTLSVLRA